MCKYAECCWVFFHLKRAGSFKNRLKLCGNILYLDQLQDGGKKYTYLMFLSLNIFFNACRRRRCLYPCRYNEWIFEERRWAGLHITTKVSGFIPPSQQMKLGAFCVAKEEISWRHAGGGTLEIDQWQICGSGSQQLEMMKLYLGVLPHLHTLKPAQTPGQTPAASMFLQTGSRERLILNPHLHAVMSSSFILGVFF